MNRPSPSVIEVRPSRSCTPTATPAIGCDDAASTTRPMILPVPIVSGCCPAAVRLLARLSRGRGASCKGLCDASWHLLFEGTCATPPLLPIGTWPGTHPFEPHGRPPFGLQGGAQRWAPSSCLPVQTQVNRTTP